MYPLIITPMKRPVKSKVCLVIIDGWGQRNEKKGNAIETTDCKWMKLLSSKYSSYLLSASGTDVGLPADQMGNSMVGHLTIGAGRVVLQPQKQIDALIATHKLKECLENAGVYKESGRLHLIGLVSDGGIHSHISHLFALIDLLKDAFSEIFVHFIADGRDTAPQSAVHYVRSLQKEIAKSENVKMASFAGRWYTMDRDKNLERVEEAYLMMTDGKVIDESIDSYINKQYDKQIYDENIPPVLLNQDGVILPNDTLLFFNYRADRMKQIVERFSRKNRKIFTLTRYDETFNFPFIVHGENVPNTLAETISRSGAAQSHIAETEKYAHVTYFLNGGREQPFENEKRFLINSPKVSSYHLKPEMSIYQIVEQCFKEMTANTPFIVLNFANPDMVGHTGNFEATCEAVLCTDECIGLVYEGCIENDYILVVTADHGNAEIMEDENGNVVTKHTSSKVPLIVCARVVGPAKTEWGFRGEGTLSDVAPTVLHLLGLEVPEEMTGRNLYDENV
ncbi:Phosphoglycerate mutase [Trachipleistophora hominis]|uniref:phosphoglycerate mutase (2,3-diphosphoglycerate-independent) n=1 Tax=Trachipleistophora hominis TaxID=72359 RepID=L7K045_TRAHO|nr:Phosphoglycerate mutase [Trachipleistophora hominis]